MLLLGIVSPLQALGVLTANWDVFLFFLGLMAIAALVERSGLFDWAAAHAAALAGGSQRRLLLNVLLLGTAISTLFSNDATWRARVEDADRVAGEAILQRAAARLRATSGAPPSPPIPSVASPATVSPALVAGQPEREIVLAARDWPAELVVVGARRHVGAPPPPGPHSVGHIARYVTDHAPCPVLLIRP
jgi:nucleotide-binding universal stress UspA family protein